MKSNNIRTKFWLEDFKVLYKDDQFLKFFPSKKMNTNEQLNALTRFSIYLFFIFILFADDIEWSLIPILILVLGVFLSRVNRFESFYSIGKTQNLKKNLKNKNSCRRPNRNNPFMNVIMSDYTEDPNRPEACDVTRDDIQNEITKNFSNNLYKNSDDIFNNKSSERQFYTTASTTIPNKQKEFAEWLYGDNDNCKINNDKCLKYSNVKYHRENILN